MIAPMTKYSFLVYHREYEQFLEDLRELGIAHIIENNQEVSQKILDQYQSITQVNRMIRSLSQMQKAPTGESPIPATSGGEELFAEATGIQQKIEALHQAKAAIQKQVADLTPWGNFDLALLDKLRQNQIRVKLYTCQARKFDQNWEEVHHIFRIGEVAGQIYFALIETGHPGHSLE